MAIPNNYWKNNATRLNAENLNILQNQVVENTDTIKNMRSDVNSHTNRIKALENEVNGDETGNDPSLQSQINENTAKTADIGIRPAEDSNRAIYPDNYRTWNSTDIWNDLNLIATILNNGQLGTMPEGDTWENRTVWSVLEEYTTEANLYDSINLTSNIAYNTDTYRVNAVIPLKTNRGTNYMKVTNTPSNLKLSWGYTDTSGNTISSLVYDSLLQPSYTVSRDFTWINTWYNLQPMDDSGTISCTDLSSSDLGSIGVSKSDIYTSSQKTNTSYYATRDIEGQRLILFDEIAGEYYSVSLSSIGDFLIKTIDSFGNTEIIINTPLGTKRWIFSNDIVVYGVANPAITSTNNLQYTSFGVAKYEIISPMIYISTYEVDDTTELSIGNIGLYESYKKSTYTINEINTNAVTGVPYSVNITLPEYDDEHNTLWLHVSIVPPKYPQKITIVGDEDGVVASYLSNVQVAKIFDYMPRLTPDNVRILLNQLISYGTEEPNSSTNGMLYFKYVKPPTTT